MNAVPSLSRPLFWLFVVVFAAIACARIISTYSVFSQSFDEPYHIACGMQWLEKGIYEYERQHPPVTRIAMALPLYLRGLRGQGDSEHQSAGITGEYAIKDGNAILNSNGAYMSNLAWARSGNLPFFLLATALLALLGDLVFDRWTAITAVGFFTLLPPILGQAGLATTDIAPIAGILAVIYALVKWVESPGFHQSAIFGLALGFALVTKFSTIPFLMFGFGATLAWTVVNRQQRSLWGAVRWASVVSSVAVAGIVAFLTIWSAYRFALAPILTGHGYQPVTASLGPVFAPIANWFLNAKLPLGEFVGGIGSVMVHNKLGHPSFLLGSFRMTGWWYYFPVVLAVKTPLAFLCLTLIAMPKAARRLWSTDWRQNLPLLFAAGILVSCMVAKINIGVRHILPIYPLLALIAAQGVVSLFQNTRISAKWLKPGVAAITVLLAAESAFAQPDYAAAFNLLAGKHPERILVNGDLDGGQDLKRLVDRLGPLKVAKLKLAYFGSADLGQMALPPFEELGADERPTGWVAISTYDLELLCAWRGSYCWLQQEKPVERVGKSIFLYQLDKPTGLPK